jgi:arylformamidase
LAIFGPTTNQRMEPTSQSPVFIDLSHVIKPGLVTYKGLPAPHICDYLSREASRQHYEGDTEFQIGKIEMVGNTGTYLDSPFHRFAHGKDLAQLTLEGLVDLPGLVVRAPFGRGLAVDVEHLRPLADLIGGRAVLIDTGWDQHWDTPAYYDQHPFLTAAAAEFLRTAGAKLVGIDSHNIDDTRARSRPVHTILLGAEIPIVEHLCHLAALPDTGFTFSAVPPKIEGMGTFPVRALAKVG